MVLPLNACLISFMRISHMGNTFDMFTPFGINDSLNLPSFKRIHMIFIQNVPNGLVCKLCVWKVMCIPWALGERRLMPWAECVNWDLKQAAVLLARA